MNKVNVVDADRCEPYWPTEDDPPMTTAGFPVPLRDPPSSQNAGKLIDLLFGSWLYNPVKTVARPRGSDAAWSSEIFSGIYEILRKVEASLEERNKHYLRNNLCWNDAILLERCLRVLKPALVDTMGNG